MLTQFDVLSADSINGLRIVPAKRPDDIIIESQTEERGIVLGE